LWISLQAINQKVFELAVEQELPGVDLIDSRSLLEVGVCRRCSAPQGRLDRIAEAAELSAKSSLIIAIRDTIERRKLTQQEAARLCETDQPTLSKVFRGRMESVTIDRLASWLNALGRDVEIIVKSTPRGRRQGRLRVIEVA